MGTASQDGVRRRFPVPRPDESHWPGLATPPHAPRRARIAEAIFRRAVAPLPIGSRRPVAPCSVPGPVVQSPVMYASPKPT